jgi:hypothetical protein
MEKGIRVSGTFSSQQGKIEAQMKKEKKRVGDCTMNSAQLQEIKHR